MSLGHKIELSMTGRLKVVLTNFKAIDEELAPLSGCGFAQLGSEKSSDTNSSYKFYLENLAEVLADQQQAPLFYKTIFDVLINSNPRGFVSLNDKNQLVAGQFLAIYITEQYRRLLGGAGQFLRSYPGWDNAHLLTTLLANFHAGQPEELVGTYVNRRYIIGAYPVLETIQIDKNQQRDLLHLSRKITDELNNPQDRNILTPIYVNSGYNIKTRWNVNEHISDFIVNDNAPRVYPEGDEFVIAIVNYLNLVRERSPEITKKILSNQ